MTLNITIVSAKRIFQCADYQTTDFYTGAALSIRTQKILHVLKNKWHASVCFSGVANWENLNVSFWLRQKIDSLPLESSFGDFLGELESANQWLVELPKAVRLHSFSVGAFVEQKPIFALLSNYENLSGLLNGGRVKKLQTFITREQATYISGQRGAINGATRRSLLKLAQGESKF